MTKESPKGLGLFVVIIVILAFMIGTAVTLDAGRNRPEPLQAPATVPFNGSDPSLHDQVEFDREMTQQMGTSVGPGMQASMSDSGMLQRTSEPSYLRELEKHAHEVDRMLARHP